MIFPPKEGPKHQKKTHTEKAERSFVVPNMSCRLPCGSHFCTKKCGGKYSRPRWSVTLPEKKLVLQSNFQSGLFESLRPGSKVSSAPANPTTSSPAPLRVLSCPVHIPTQQPTSRFCGKNHWVVFGHQETSRDLLMLFFFQGPGNGHF